MSTNLVVAYHLSHSKVPLADSQGLFKVLTAEFVFNHWQSGQIYLHQVSYPQQAISNHYEDGHHDEVSSFSWDEFVMVNNLNSQQFWQLNNRESLFALLESQFMSDLRSTLFCSQDALHRAIFSLANIELTIDYIRHGQLTKEDLFSSLSLEHIELVRALLASGLLNEEDFCACSLANIEWKTLTTEKDAFMGMTLESKLGLSDSIEALLWAVYDESNPPKTEQLSTIIVALALLNQRPWQHYLKLVKTISLPSGLIVMLLRLQQAATVKVVLQNANIKLDFTGTENSCDYLLDRIAVYQQVDLLKSLHNKLDSFDKAQIMRLVSSLAAAGLSQFQMANFTNIDAQEILHWQEQEADQSLEHAASCGYLLLSQKILARESITQAQLDSALLAAAQMGYCEIVKLLHNHGGSLEVSGRWPIRYANKYSYQQLKNYLLAQGQEDLHF